MKDFETLLSGEKVCTEKGVFGIGTDSLLLADFINIKKTDAAADIGAGCGVLGFSVSKVAKSCLFIDRDPAATALIEKSISENGLFGRFETLTVDVAELPKELYGRFDAVLCNPPYYFGDGREPLDEKRLAARHGDLGVFIGAAARLLKNGGKFFAVYPAEKLFSFSSLCEKNGLSVKRLRFARKNRESAPFIFLAEARKGGGAGVKIESDVFTEGL